MFLSQTYTSMMMRIRSHQIVAPRYWSWRKSTVWMLSIVALFSAQHNGIVVAMPLRETTPTLQSSSPPSSPPSAAPSSKGNPKTIAPSTSHSNFTVAPSSSNSNATKAPTAVPVPPNVTTKAPSLVPPSSPSSSPSAAPSAAPSAKKNSSSAVPSYMPSQPPSHAPSRAPSLAPTTAHHKTSPPSHAPTAPPPTFAPSAAADDHHRHHLSIWKILGKTIAWFILLILGVLLFGACMSNRYRIFYFLRGVWYTVLQLDCTIRLVQWFARLRGAGGGGGLSVDASLNTIIFDNEMSEGLLMRETNE